MSADQLACEGGEPVRTTPLPSWPIYSAEEIAAVTEVLQSGKVNYWSGNASHGRLLEEEYAARLGVPFAVACANGTLALELCLRGLGIGAGDEVIVTPRSFFASTSAVMLVGATPVFADIDRDSEALDVAALGAALTPATKAILPVHLNGWPADMPAMTAFAAKHDLLVIEDCAQSHGAKIDGRETGSFGDASALSFCVDKIISSGGEGGIAFFKDRQAFKRAWAFKDHGKDWDTMSSPPKTPGFQWQHESLGSNYRMPEMNAAIARIQLARLDATVKRRQHNADMLRSALAPFSCVRVPVVPANVENSQYKFSFFVEAEKLSSGWTRDRIQDAIEAEGIPIRAGGCPEIYRQPVMQRDPQANNFLPVAHELGQTSLMLMVHHTLTDDDMADVALALKKVLTAAQA